MPLHSKVKGEEFDGQRLSVNPLYARDDEIIDIPKHRMPDGPMPPEMVVYPTSAPLSMKSSTGSWSSRGRIPTPLHGIFERIIGLGLELSVLVVSRE